jgi:hypothetical protein
MKNVYLWFVAMEGAKMAVAVKAWRDLATLLLADLMRMRDLLKLHMTHM